MRFNVGQFFTLLLQNVRDFFCLGARDVWSGLVMCQNDVKLQLEKYSIEIQNWNTLIDLS